MKYIYFAMILSLLSGCVSQQKIQSDKLPIEKKCETKLYELNSMEKSHLFIKLYSECKTNNIELENLYLDNLIIVGEFDLYDDYVKKKKLKDKILFEDI
ncbi:TPA: hypothetical protein ACX6S1_002786 [Photobacterium damselae]